MKIKRAIALIVASVMMLGLAGCNKDENKDPLLSESKSELVTYIRTLEEEGESSSARIAELEELLRGTQDSEIKTSAIEEFNDGTGKLTLVSVDDAVQLPVPFTYPNSIQTANTSSINISDNITIKPTPNWTIKLSGTEILLEHSNGINGKITVGKVDKTQDRIKIEDLNEHINTFFESMPPEKISYTRVFLKDNWSGSDAMAHTYINQEDAFLRCGLVNQGDICITYFFNYKGEQDIAKDELILTLLQTMKVLGQDLRIE